MARPHGKNGATAAKVEAWRHLGFSVQAIADRLGVSHQAVTYHLRRRGPVCPACGVKLTLAAIRRVNNAEQGRDQ